MPPILGASVLLREGVTHLGDPATRKIPGDERSAEQDQKVEPISATLSRADPLWDALDVRCNHGDESEGAPIAVGSAVTRPGHRVFGQQGGENVGDDTQTSTGSAVPRREPLGKWATLVQNSEDGQ